MAELIVKNGWLLGDGPSAVRGDLLVQDGVIVDLGIGVKAAEAEVIDATGKLIAPGLVDTHLHLWQTPLRGMTSDLWAKEYFGIVHPMSNYYSPEDIYWATYAGALELLSNGVTQVFDYCHSVNSPAHPDASMRALRDSGIRATFGISTLARSSSTYRDLAERLDDIERLAAGIGPASLVDVAVCIDGEFDPAPVRFARDHGLRVSAHANPMGFVTQFNDAEPLGPDVLLIHGNSASDRELDIMAASGSYLALTPDIEMGMGKPVAIFRRAAQRGVRITLGVDVASYVAADLLSQMRLAYAMCRTLDGAEERALGHVPPSRDAGLPLVSARNVLDWASGHGAAALGASVLGVRVGARADLVLINVHPFGLSIGDVAGHVVLQTTTRDIHTVIVDGRVRVRAGRLVDVDIDALGLELSRSRARLLAQRDAVA